MAGLATCTGDEAASRRSGPAAGLPRLRLLALTLILLMPVPACQGQQAVPPEAGRAARPAEVDSAFARLVAHLSEPGGYFDTDNLISNEASYLHVLGAMRELGLTGGAYIGVGPDQNFAYIAQVRPSIAFMIDIRRDNLLQHLFFKSLFALARNRIEYLCLLFGKPLPDPVTGWEDANIQQLVDYIDRTPTDPAGLIAVRARVREGTIHAGLSLSAPDLETVERIHDSFIRAGLDLRFTSHHRRPQFYYPTYRQLLLEKDLTGRHGSYLASEEAFRFIKHMHARDRIVPVVGDLAGAHALAAIGRYLAARGEHVSVFYTSNVEFYLMGDGAFDRFIENVRQLPIHGQSVIVRSYFNRYSRVLPQSVPGYLSTQLLQRIQDLIAEHTHTPYRSYWDLVSRQTVELPER